MITVVKSCLCVCVGTSVIGGVGLCLLIGIFIIIIISSWTGVGWYRRAVDLTSQETEACFQVFIVSVKCVSVHVFD